MNKLERATYEQVSNKEFIVIKRNDQASNSSSDQRWPTASSKTKQLVKRKRLTTLMPILEPPLKPEKGLAAESRLKSRHPVITPSCEAPEPSIENQQRPSPEEVINAQLQQPYPKAFESHSQIKVAALLCSFSMVLGALIGAYACYTPRSQNPDNTAARTVDPQPPTVIADRSVTTAPRLQTATVLQSTLLLTEPSVEEVRQEEEVELIDEVLQLAQEANQELEVQLAADETEPPLRDEEEAAALVARVTKLLGKPIGNVDNDDIPNEDAPLTDAPPALEPINQPDIKKPIEITSIQKLDADQLRAMLQTKTPSIDLFQSKEEFADAKNYLRRRAPFKEPAIQGSNQRTLQKNLLKSQPEATVKANDPAPEYNPFELLSNHLSEREDLQALPLTMDDQCRVNREEANAISSVSRKLGRLISEASGGARGVALRNSGNAALRSKAIKENQDKALAQLRKLVRPDSHPQYLKTTDQILQAQHWQDRLELVNTLKGTDNSTAINLLAKRAKYDLSSDVRMSATNALAEFSRDQYRAELLAGLAYPWHVVAQHSAEALVRLDDKKAIPELVEMLDLPHPTAPVEIEPDKFVQPTLVAINHMRNCLLCHEPSLSRRDRTTGTVPNWDSPIPQQYYAHRHPDFVSVRADITYLKQDFSVVQPVVDHGLWPDKQRFDFVVQQKPLTPSKAIRIKKKFDRAKNRNREAIVFALKKLSNLRPEDNSSESWKAILKQENAARLAQADSR